MLPRMPTFATTDLCDAHPEVTVLPTGFRDYGGQISFGGPIETLRVEDDNVLVRAALEEPGAGLVLVIDGGGSLACALLGDQLAALALSTDGRRHRAWVRARCPWRRCPSASGRSPRTPQGGKPGTGRGVAIGIDGQRLRPGAYIYADATGSSQASPMTWRRRSVAGQSRRCR
jgi:regulator of ribonuclease activity A